jgi:hypothetical protein
MLEQTLDEQKVIDRVAALDIGKAELVCCVRVPDSAGGSRRVQEVTTYSTMTRSLQLMADRLLDLGVSRVVMEATSDYWDSRELHQTGAEMAVFPRFGGIAASPLCAA